MLAKKRVATDVVSKYSFEQSDQLTDTIKREMQTLFQCVAMWKRQMQSYISKGNGCAAWDEGFEISYELNQTVVYANTSKGWLYGFFELYKHVIRTTELPENLRSIPNQAIRMVNHWDNFDGTIERGYAGESIFFQTISFGKTMKRYATMRVS